MQNKNSVTTENHRYLEAKLDQQRNQAMLKLPTKIYNIMFLTRGKSNCCFLGTHIGLFYHKTLSFEMW